MNNYTAPKRWSSCSPFKLYKTDKCIFGEEHVGVTGEHFFPEWSQSILAPAPVKKHPWEHVSIRFHPEQSRSERTFDKTGSAAFRRFYCVCEGCNNGWMSGIEGKAKPALTRLVLGERPNLSAEESADLATWATLKTIVSQFGSEPENFTFLDTEISAFYNSKRALPGWQIWIGRLDIGGRRWCSQLRGDLRPGDASGPAASAVPRHNMTAMLVTFGHLFLFVFTPCEALSSFALRDMKLRLSMQQIWPELGASALFDMQDDDIGRIAAELRAVAPIKGA